MERGEALPCPCGFEDRAAQGTGRVDKRGDVTRRRDSILLTGTWLPSVTSQASAGRCRAIMRPRWSEERGRCGTADQTLPSSDRRLHNFDNQRWATPGRPADARNRASGKLLGLAPDFNTSFDVSATEPSAVDPKAGTGVVRKVPTAPVISIRGTRRPLPPLRRVEGQPCGTRSTLSLPTIPPRTPDPGGNILTDPLAPASMPAPPKRKPTGLARRRREKRVLRRGKRGCRRSIATPAPVGREA